MSARPAKQNSRRKAQLTANQIGSGPNGACPDDDSSVELHRLLVAMQAMKNGDFSARMAGHHAGLMGKIAETFNDIVAPRGGRVVNILVSDGSPVEYDQPLMVIE